MRVADITQAEAKALLAKHGSIRQTAKFLGIDRGTFRARLEGKGVRKGGKAPSPTPCASKTPAPKAERRNFRPKVKSVDQFRDLYDKDTIIPRKIEAGIASLGDGWVYESEFSRLAEVSHSQLSTYREGYLDHVVQTPDKKIWVGDVKIAQKMRELV
jgi:hypothetical protein